MTDRVAPECPAIVECPHCHEQVRVLTVERTPRGRIFDGHQVKYIDTEQRNIVDVVIIACNKRK